MGNMSKSNTAGINFGKYKPVWVVCNKCKEEIRRYETEEEPFNSKVRKERKCTYCKGGILSTKMIN